MVTSRRAFIGYGSVLAGGFIAGWWSVGLVEYMGSASDTPWKTLTPDEADTLDRIAEELIPADPPSAENGGIGIPGAHDAKVVRCAALSLRRRRRPAHSATKSVAPATDGPNPRTGT